MGKSKRYVEVFCKHDEVGNVLPASIIWGDGRSFLVDAVLDVRPAAAEVGGNGIRYLVRIGNRESYLFYENPRWFVQANAPQSDE